MTPNSYQSPSFNIIRQAYAGEIGKFSPANSSNVNPNTDATQTRAYQRLFAQGVAWLKGNGQRIFSGIGGSAQMVTGAAMIASGFGAPVGALLVTHGANNLYEGITGNDGGIRMAYQKAALMMNLSEAHGNIAYGVVDIGASLGGLVSFALKPGAWKLYVYDRNIDFVRRYQTMNVYGLGFEGFNAVTSINSTISKVNQ